VCVCVCVCENFLTEESMQCWLTNRSRFKAIKLINDFWMGN